MFFGNLHFIDIKGLSFFLPSPCSASYSFCLFVFQMPATPIDFETSFLPNRHNMNKISEMTSFLQLYTCYNSFIYIFFQCLWSFLHWVKTIPHVYNFPLKTYLFYILEKLVKNSLNDPVHADQLNLKLVGSIIKVESVCVASCNLFRDVLVAVDLKINAMQNVKNFITFLLYLWSSTAWGHLKIIPRFLFS